jgi:hypothetical protein
MAILILYVWPQKSDLAVARRALSVVEARYDSLSESKKSLDELDIDIDENMQQAVFLSMPVTYSPQDAIASIRSVASRTGVSIVGYKLPSGVLYDSELTEDVSGSINEPKPRKAKESGVRFQSFRLRVNLSGRINDLVEFISLVKSSLPVASVSDLSVQELTTMTRKSVDSGVQLELELIYYQPVINTFDLTLLKKFSEEEKDLMDELVGYMNNKVDSVVETPVSAGTNQNLFGL